MGKWLIRKPEPSNVQGTCVTCKERPQKKSQGRYRAECGRCYKIRFGKGAKRTYASAEQRFKRSIKKDRCECCGFIPVHPCQLDVDHIDGNSQNNNIENLQTLCANCHRLKTLINEDWK